MVEHDLAKVGVASSSLVSRSKLTATGHAQRSIPPGAALSSPEITCTGLCAQTGEFATVKAGWQSGHAADCNSAYAGSIPTPASIFPFKNINLKKVNDFMLQKQGKSAVIPQ